jgi:hypothetical protein
MRLRSDPGGVLERETRLPRQRTAAGWAALVLVEAHGRLARA